MVSVLLIDDDADFREEVRLGLEKEGYQVTAVLSGNSGVAVFKRQPHDIVITDVVMDDGEGVETMKQLHHLSPDLPIIAVSAHQLYLGAMEKLGARRSLSKPFRMSSLIEAVTQLTSG